MHIREKINQQPKVAIGVAVTAIVLAFGAIFVMSSDQPGLQSTAEPQAWYTIDDGRTWFASSASRVVPFEHEGKRAYRAYVWTCDGGKTQFVSHLERISSRARQHFAGKDKVQPWELFPGSLEVKAPLTGDRGWANADSREAVRIQSPRCPDGQPGPPQSVPAQ